MVEKKSDEKHIEKSSETQVNSTDEKSKVDDGKKKTPKEADDERKADK